MIVRACLKCGNNMPRLSFKMQHKFHATRGDVKCPYCGFLYKAKTLFFILYFIFLLFIAMMLNEILNDDFLTGLVLIGGLYVWGGIVPLAEKHPGRSIK